MVRSHLTPEWKLSAPLTSPARNAGVEKGAINSTKLADILSSVLVYTADFGIDSHDTGTHTIDAIIVPQNTFLRQR